jgi:hypothetical protein
MSEFHGALLFAGLCAVRSVRLTGAHIAEDMQIGFDSARAGKAPLFCPDVPDVAMAAQ